MDAEDVMDALVTEMNTVIAAMSPQIAGPVRVGKGFPSQAFLLDVARKGGAGISLFDRSPAKNTTRWIGSQVVSEVATTPGVAAVLSGNTLSSGRTRTITLSGTVKVNDAVALTAYRLGPLKMQGASVVAISSDTPTTLAAKLATAINAAPAMAALMSAGAAGAVVTLTGLPTIPVLLRVAAGNIRVQQVEYMRFNRELQVMIWTANELDRKALGKALMGDFGRIYSNFGLQVADGTWLRLIPAGDLLFDKNIKEDLYRRDILLDAEYGVTAAQVAYDILSSQPNLTVE